MAPKQESTEELAKRAHGAIDQLATDFRKGFCNGGLEDEAHRFVDAALAAKRREALEEAEMAAWHAMEDRHLRSGITCGTIDQAKVREAIRSLADKPAGGEEGK